MYVIDCHTDIVCAHVTVHLTPVSGCILLDVEGDDFPHIAQEITNNLLLSGQLPLEHTDAMLRVLLKKHKHTHDVTLWEKMKQSALDPGEWHRHSIVM